MKTTFLAVILLLLNVNYSFSQFSRTYMYNEISKNVHTNFVLKTSSTEYDLIHISDSLEIISTSINAQGDVSSEIRFQFPFTYTLSNAQLNITGVFDNVNERTIVFSEASATSQNLHFIRFDKTTGNLLATYQAIETSKGLAFSTQLINGEYVHYYVTPTLELKRLSVSQTLGSETTETVSTLTNIGLTAFSFMNNFQFAKLLTINNNETLVLNGGVTNVTFCTRTGANFYSLFTSTALSAYPFDACIDGTTVAVLTKKTVSRFDFNNALLASSVFTSNNSGSGIIYPKNGNLYVISKLTIGETRFFELNSSLSPMDSVFLNKQIQFRPNVIEGSETVILGHVSGKPSDMNYEGQLTNSIDVPLLITFTNTPDFNHEEYSVPFQKDNLYMKLMVGENILFDPIYQVASLKYDNINSIIYSSSSQVVSKDNSNNIYSGNNYKIEHLAGPYTTNSLYDQIIESKYNRGFLVSKQMILDHLDAVSSGVPNYVAPHAIRNWPAHGDVSKGQAANLAPFVDLNVNGQYEPYLGEYPSIYGDQCFLSISHTRSNVTNSDGIELHTYLYSIDCNEASFENTVFKKIIAYSRKMDLDSVFIAETDDIDLGNYSDDYTGTHVELGMTYFYNGDLTDETFATNIGFDTLTPAFGIMQLKGTKMIDDGIDNQESPLLTTPTNGFGINDGVIDNEYYTLENSSVFIGSGGSAAFSDPASGSEWWNIVNGRWKFGDIKYYESTSIPTKYMFPWTSDTVMYGTNGASVPYTWSEYEPTGSGSAATPSGDRRLVSNSKSLSLNVGESVEYDYAYVFYRDSIAPTDVYSPVLGLIEKATAIKNAYNDSTSACGYVFAPIQEDLAVNEQVNTFDFSIYPNPTSGKLTIIQSESTGSSQIFVSDAQGKVIVEKSFDENETTIDLNQFEGNLFFVTLINNQQKAQKKIVKL